MRDADQLPVCNILYFLRGAGSVCNGNGGARHRCRSAPRKFAPASHRVLAGRRCCNLRCPGPSLTPGGTGKPVNKSFRGSRGGHPYHTWWNTTRQANRGFADRHTRLAEDTCPRFTVTCCVTCFHGRNCPHDDTPTHCYDNPNSNSHTHSHGDPENPSYVADHACGNPSSRPTPFGILCQLHPGSARTRCLCY